jgi:hypothetical protein
MVRSVKGISGDRSEPVMYAMIYDYGMAPDIAVERLILQIARKFFFCYCNTCNVGNRQFTTPNVVMLYRRDQCEYQISPSPGKRTKEPPSVLSLRTHSTRSGNGRRNWWRRPRCWRLLRTYRRRSSAG